jgi:hypothetical protein
MTKLDEYRNKAENCERLAQKAKDQDVKESLQEAARSWRRLAATEPDGAVKGQGCRPPAAN